MSTLDLLDDSFPHGTPDGYRQGCRSAACPAVIPCRTVHSRYSGDYSFARLIDAGVPLAEILERDAAERANARQGDRAAAREARRAADTPAKRTPSRKAPPTPRAKRKPAPGRDVDEYQRALEQRSDELARWQIERRRLREALALITEQLEAATIATGAGLSLGGVIEQALLQATQRHAAAAAELAAHDEQRPSPPTKPRRQTTPRPRTSTTPRQLQPHGTHACRARGCDRPECIEAGRTYHREWMAKRATAPIPRQHHGTAYGYQLGCKDRDQCPAETSCADASLAEERRRRRESGVAPQAPRVSAEPIRQHVRQLMASGMAVLEITDQAQVSKTGVKILLYGRSGARKGELPREIEAEKAQRLLALEPLTAAPKLERSA